MLSRNSIISAACGFVLSMGAVVILVLITGSFAPVLPPALQGNLPLFVFLLSLLVIMPLVYLRLCRLDGISRIMGWTFIGLGTEFLAFPVSLLFIIRSASSPGTLLMSLAILTFSVIFGVAAGLVCTAIGVFLIKRR
ncbi:MAG: hypothetical protein OIN66_01855 [Candidatus Methanoperedens sp.]|nr:hypothetical protein [Candidatus Methanoperedens sp.]